MLENGTYVKSATEELHVVVVGGCVPTPPPHGAAGWRFPESAVSGGCGHPLADQASNQHQVGLFRDHFGCKPEIIVN